MLETSYTSLLFCYLFLISKKVVVDYNLYSSWHFTFVGGPAEEAWEPLGQGKGPGNAKAYESPHNNNKDVRVNMFVPFLFSHCPLWFRVACFGVITGRFLPLCAHVPSLRPPSVPHHPCTSHSNAVQVMYSGKGCTVIVSLGLPAVRQTLASPPELPAEGKEGWRGKRKGTIKMQNHHGGVVQHLAPLLLLRGSHLMMERVCVWWRARLCECGCVWVYIYTICLRLIECGVELQ